MCRTPLSLAATFAVALGAAGCSGDADDRRTPGAVADPGTVHVHGLGVDPGDGALFIATHTGLFRLDAEERRATRVAGRFQDTMGFTVTGPGRFLGSGHPDGREELPPFLGLIESRDAGETWVPVSLLGARDFHVLEATGRHVYGYGSDFRTREASLLASRDGGRTWQMRTAPEPLLSLAIDPEDSDHIVASGEARVSRSTDAGRRWRPAAGEPSLLTWPASGPLYAVDFTGAVRRSDDAAASWRTVGQIGGEPAAFEAAGPDDLYAALHDGTIERSTDGGATWSVRSAR